MRAIKRAEATDNFRVLPFTLTMSLSKWPAMNSAATLVKNARARMFGIRHAPMCRLWRKVELEIT